MTQVRILGPFELVRDGAAVDTAGWQPRALTLFKLIASAPDRRRSRDDLIDVLWPDATPDAGASNLRYTLHLLRRALGSMDPSPVLYQAGWVSLNPAYTWEIDLDRFNALIHAAGDNLEQLEAAAELYRSEPFEEDRYEDWAMPLREGVQRAWRDLCLRLAHGYKEQERNETAAGWYERFLQSDPLDEEIVQKLISLLIGSGRQTEALRVFQRFEQRLREELDLGPMPETVALVEPIRNQRRTVAAIMPRSESSAGLVPVPVTPSYFMVGLRTLAGREKELHHILGLLPEEGGRSPSVSARLLLVGADAGMGKTHLLSEVSRLTRERGTLVLAGGCYEEEGRLPYGPFHDALLDFLQAQPDVVLDGLGMELLSPLAEIVPELRSRLPELPRIQAGDPQALRLQLFSTIAQILQQISAGTPLLLVLDDLHWADDATLQLLHFLLRQARMERVLMVGAFRSDEVPANGWLDQLVKRADREEAFELIRLSRLDQPDIARILEDRLGGRCDPGLVAALYRRSTGNPFFSIQMARLLGQAGQLQREGERWSLKPGSSIDLPPAVQDTLARRLRFISADERLILSIGAVLGREFDFAALEAISEKDEDALFTLLDGAQDAGLIRETGDGYAFVHPLLWEVMYSRVPDQRRRRLHDRAGLALERLYGEAVEEKAAELAWHFLESGNREPALRYSLAAGRAAERVVAHAEADRHYRAAVNLARAVCDQEREAEALEMLGGILKAIGKLDEAITMLQDGIQVYRELGNAAGEARTAAQAAMTYYFQDAFEEGREFLQPIIQRFEERVDPNHPSQDLAVLYAALPRVLMGLPHEELAAARRAAELGQVTGDQSIVAAAYLRQGTALETGLRRHEEALAAFEKAIELATSIGDLFTLAAAYGFASDSFRALGDFAKWYEYADRSAEAVERRGGLEQMGGLMWRAYNGAIAVGDWNRVQKYADRQIALQQSLTGEISDPAPLFWRAEVALLRGDLDGAERQLSEATERANVHGNVDYKIRSALLLAELDLLHGNPEAARDRLQMMLGVPTADQPVQLSANLTTDQAKALLVQAWALAETGSVAEARAVLHFVKVDSIEKVNALATIDRLRVEGHILRAEGCFEEAVARFQESATRAHPMPYPYGEARALYFWGCLLLDEGSGMGKEDGGMPHDKSGGACALLQRALGIFDRLGAAPYADRAREALARCDGRHE
ncbi:MAG TPA: AAA family ATPase [Chloroflexota bacterium]